jgi:hypothetical protein
MFYQRLPRHLNYGLITGFLATKGLYIIPIQLGIDPHRETVINKTT